MDAKIILNCTSYRFNVLSSKSFNFRFNYDDEQGKIFRNTSARAVAHYTFKDNNTPLMTTTINFSLITPDLRVFCGGGDVQHGSSSVISLFISAVNDNESKLY